MSAHAAAAAGAAALVVGASEACGLPQAEPAPGVLPDGWSSVVCPRSGRTYYFNRVTGETTWEPPAVLQAVPAAIGDRGERGLSVQGLHLLAEKSAGRTSGQMWSQVWIQATAPKGWTAEVVRHPTRASATQEAVNQWVRDVYTNEQTGEQLLKTPENINEFVSPPGCCAVIDAYAEELKGCLGAPTHYLSYGWHVPFEEVVQAVDLEISGNREGSFVWMDLCCNIFHSDVDYSPQGVREKLRGLRLVQVCAAWNEPERLKRLWIMFELYVAIADGNDISLAMTPKQQMLMASELRERGPEAILDVIFKMNPDVDAAKISGSEQDRQDIISMMTQLVEKVGGQEQMNLQLAEATRRAYAAAIQMEFERQWESAGPTAEVLDLGHQLAALWALTEDQAKARRMFEKVLAAIKQKPQSWKEGKVARLDKTSAALVALILQGGSEVAHLDAYRVEKDALGGELAVSFKGVSVEFLARFAERHDAELSFISTDATVERVIKPASKRASGFGQVDTEGRAYIETLDEKWKGPLSSGFFLSHAWRQTFHVSEVEWRGGVVQAVVHSARCGRCKASELSGDGCTACKEQRENTFVWFDVFCVNQHLVSPYGGLLAFAFEPLRNAVVYADHLEMFLETWDDPATLSRVWCLEELRVAMMFGKDVRVCMPKQAMRSFHKRAKENPKQTIEDINKAVERISIEHASATFDRDRREVFGNIDNSVGRKAINDFAKETMRMALVQTAFPDGPPVDLGADLQRTGAVEQICADILSVADKPETNRAQEIRIRRAVALMRLRENPKSVTGMDELKSVAAMALRYYGPRAQEVRDIQQQVQARA